MYKYLYPDLNICRKCSRHKVYNKSDHACQTAGNPLSYEWRLFQYKTGEWVGGHATNVPFDCPYRLEQVVSQKKPPKSFLESALKCQAAIDDMMFTETLKLLHLEGYKRKILRWMKKANVSKAEFAEAIK